MKPDNGIIETPFKIITSAENDKFIDKLDITNYEKSMGSEFKNAWQAFTSFFGAEEGPVQQVSRTPRELKLPPKIDHIDKEKGFLIETYEALLYAKSKSHGVSIKTMTRVVDLFRRSRNLQKIKKLESFSAIIFSKNMPNSLIVFTLKIFHSIQ